jgi:hypothetical protein
MIKKQVSTANMKIDFCKTTGKFLGFIDGKLITKSKSKKRVERICREHSAGTEFVTGTTNDSRFGINERFEFVGDLVTMVANKTSASAIITGEGGLGKTYTVVKTLEANGMEDASNLMEAEDEDEIMERDDKQFTIVKGFSTAKGLYRILFEHRNSFLVFDDCDSVLKDPVAVNLLKGALDSYDKRIISWNCESKGDDDLPRSFQFNGGVIFISNLTLATLNQALRSRSLCVDLSMTLEQKIERMGSLIEMDGFMPGVSKQFKKDALALIDANKKIASEISLRTLIKVAKIRAGGAKNWMKLAEYVLSN